MRKLVAVLACGVALLGAAPNRPSFEYKGFRGGEVVPAPKLATCRSKQAASEAPSPTPTKPAEGIAGPLRQAQQSSDDQLRNLFSEWRKSEGGDSDPFPHMTSCGAINPTIAGVRALSETILLHKNKLSSVSVMFPMTGFKTVTEAFTAKYGKPCAVTIKQVQNRMGARFPSPHYEWCFAQGRLKADMYYPDLETSTAEWEDPQNQPVAPAPKVDF